MKVSEKCPSNEDILSLYSKQQFESATRFTAYRLLTGAIAMRPV